MTDPVTLRERILALGTRAAGCEWPVPHDCPKGFEFLWRDTSAEAADGQYRHSTLFDGGVELDAALVLHRQALGLCERVVAEEWARVPQAVARPLVLEVGTADGLSSAFIAAAGCRVVTCDPRQSPIARILWDGLDLASHIEYVQGHSHEPHTWRGIYPSRVWMAFIDGEHTAGAVRQDFESIEALLAPGARVYFHDTEYEKNVRRGLEQVVGRVQARAPNDVVVAEARTPRGLSWFTMPSEPAT